MKAQSWGFKNAFAYRPGIAEWKEKYPDLAVFQGQILAENKGALVRLQEDYKKHTLSTRAFLRKSREKGTVVFDVRELNNRDHFPVDLPTLKHYPVDRLVKLVNSGSRKVRRKKLLILDNCGKQSMWLEHVLSQAGLQNYNFLKGGTIAWQRDGYDRHGRYRGTAGQ